MKLTLEFDNIGTLEVVASVYKLLSTKDRPYLYKEDGDHILNRIGVILYLIESEVKGPFNKGDGDFYTIGDAEIYSEDGFALIEHAKHLFSRARKELGDLKEE